jgi:hypothetical protein
MPAQTQAPKVGRAAALAAKSGDAPASAPWGAATDAARYEQEIADRATGIRGEDFDGTMTPALFLRLWPLLREPLHEGHIVHTTAGKGKPYESDGAKSVQVLIDRCNNVLTPLCWGYSDGYESNGKLCKVVVMVYGSEPGGTVLVSRSSWGGVDRGSEGNIRKGSFTNAAKLAFARLGPGHEIYLGGHDFDPDTNAQIAALQGRESKERTSRNGADTGEAAVQQTTPAEALAALLAQAGPLQAKRAAVNAAFDFAHRELGREVAAGQRLRELQGAPDERTLDELLARINDYVAAEVAKREGEAS